MLYNGLEFVSENSESGALLLSSVARHIDFHSSRRIYVVLLAHSIALSLPYLLLYGGNVRIAAGDLWLHSYFPRFGSISTNAKCNEQKLLLYSGLELVSDSSESGALSLSSAARHIDFHSSRRIYVVLVAHSIALSLQTPS